MEGKVLIEVSARHAHLTQEVLEALFGEGYELTPKKYLSQPGEYAAEERVTIVGSKGEINNVIILGPTRKYTQVEISLTDSRKLGVNALIRESGDVEGTCGCKLIGPAGEIELDNGVIIAKRHIHLKPEQAKQLNVENHEIVEVKIETPYRTTTFGDVVVRVNESYDAAMHIDTDEGNAAGIDCTTYGVIVK